MACVGLKTAVNINGKEYLPKLLFGKENPSLYFYDAYCPSGATIRSINCSRKCHSPTNICQECQAMLRDDKFQHTLKRAQVSANKQQKFTNDAYLPRPALLARVKGLRIEMRLKKKNNMFLQTSYNELKRAKTRLSSILSECTARKDTKAIIYNLRCAYEKGYLSDKDNVLSLIQNVTANLQKKNHGKRYEKNIEKLLRSSHDNRRAKSDAFCG